MNRRTIHLIRRSRRTIRRGSRQTHHWCRSPTSCFLNRCCLRLTNQNAPSRSCRLSARLRRPFLRTASRRTRPARPRYHETTIRLPSFRMSCPTIHP